MPSHYRSVLLCLAFVFLINPLRAADGWLGTSKEKIRLEFKERMAVAPIFGDADDSDAFQDGDYLTTFGYKQGVVVYVIRKKDKAATMSESDLIVFNSRSRAGGRWFESARVKEKVNPDLTWKHQKKDGDDWLDTGVISKTKKKRQRIISFTPDWNGDPDDAATRALLDLPLDELIEFLKKEGARVK